MKRPRAAVAGQPESARVSRAAGGRNWAFLGAKPTAMLLRVRPRQK